MVKFLKQNCLVLGVLFFGYAAYSLAGTITRPYGPTDYAGGQKAVGAKVNAEFQSIVDWLNGGNIGTQNIASGGVATANIAAGAVTDAKITGPIGMDKIPANIAFTAASGSYVSTHTTGPMTVTNLTTTLTTKGNIVYLSLEGHEGAASGGSDVSSVYVAGGTASVFSWLFFVTDSSTTGVSYITTAATYPCSSFRASVRGLGAGVHTFSVKVQPYDGTVSGPLFSVSNCILVVREGP